MHPVVRIQLERSSEVSLAIDSWRRKPLSIDKSNPEGLDVTKRVYVVLKRKDRSL